MDWAVIEGSEPFLHPGRTASVVVAGSPVGWLGEIHPSVAAEWELGGAVAAFEVDLDAVFASVPGPVHYEDYTSFPEVRQDLAVVVPATVAAGELVRVVREAGGPLLAAADVFDVYRGAQIGEDEVSLALRLAFRSPERTLTDEEVAERRAAIEAALAEDRRADPCLGQSSVNLRPLSGRRSTVLGSRCWARPDMPARSPPRCCTAIRASSSWR